MTDFILRGKNKREKETSGKKSHRFIFILFGLLIITFIFINVIGRSYGAIKAVSNISWDGKSSFSVSIGKTIFVYQQEPKRVVFLNFDSGLTNNGSDKVKKLSMILGVPVDYYLNVKNETFENLNNVENTWKDFTSYATPLKILTGNGFNVMDTNMSRMDAIKLWWQAKSIGLNKIEMVNLGKADAENNKRVLGARSDDLNRSVNEYFENVNIIDDKLDVKIVNTSGVVNTGYLASKFITSVGGNVTNINSDVNIAPDCKILAPRRNYTVGYLAKLFQCDINDASEGENEGEITIFIGSDFSKKYFE